MAFLSKTACGISAGKYELYCGCVQVRFTINILLNVMYLKIVNLKNKINDGITA